jgi:hypothetical protein
MRSGCAIAISISVVLNVLFIIATISIGVIVAKVRKAFVNCIGSASPSALRELKIPSYVPTTFDRSVALFVAQLIHEFALNPRAFIPPASMTIVEFLLPSHIGCILRDDKDRTWVIFRGTQTKEEARLDLQFGQEEGIHRGFKTLFNSFKQNIQNIAFSKQFIIGGHSLGGALCTLTMNAMNQDNTVGYAFGSPRVGNTELTIRMKDRHFFNVMNSDDIVTNLPLAVSPNFANPSKPLIYEHVGQLIWFSWNWGSILKNHLLSIYEQFLREPESNQQG